MLSLGPVLITFPTPQVGVPTEYHYSSFDPSSRHLDSFQHGESSPQPTYLHSMLHHPLGLSISHRNGVDGKHGHWMTLKFLLA
jgi:hypothetical protein